MDSKKRYLPKEKLMQEILIACKANGVSNDGDIFLSLAFRTQAELVKICHELHINPKNPRQVTA